MRKTFCASCFTAFSVSLSFALNKTFSMTFFLAFGESDFMFSHQVRHVFYLAIEKLFCKINQFHRIKQPSEGLVLHNLFGNGFLLDNHLDGAEPLSRLGVVVYGDTCLFKLEELVDFHKNLLDLGEELPPVAHFIDMVNVFLRLLREKCKVQEPEEVNTRQFVLFACMHLILDDAGHVIFHTVAVKFVTLLLHFH